MRKLSSLSPTAWVTAQTVFVQGFGLLLFAVQAPLLGPRAFGLISIVMAFIGCVDFVVGEAAIDALVSLRTIEPEHYAVMTAFCTLVGLLIGLALYLLGPLIAVWFAQPELTSICHWMAVWPCLAVIAVAPNAASKREVHFQPLAVRAIVSQLIGGIVGVVLMVLGFGVWALVWQSIVQKLFAALILWNSADLPLRFGRSLPHFRQFRPYLVPGLLSRLMSWGASQVPRLALGLFVGATELGIFGLASRLSDILLQVILVPRAAVARVSLREFAVDRAGLGEAVHQLVLRCGFITFPLCIGGAAVMPTLFHAWLDSRWLPGIVPAQWMILIAIPYVTLYVTGSLLLAFNQQAAEAAAATVQTLSAIVVTLVAAPFGIAYVASASLIRLIALMPVGLMFTRNRCAIPAAAVLRPQGRLLAAAAAMGAGVWALREVGENYLGSRALLPILVASGAVLYALALYAASPPFALRVYRAIRLRFLGR